MRSPGHRCRCLHSLRLLESALQTSHLPFKSPYERQRFPPAALGAAALPLRSACYTARGRWGALRPRRTHPPSRSGARDRRLSPRCLSDCPYRVAEVQDTEPVGVCDCVCMQRLFVRISPVSAYLSDSTHRFALQQLMVTGHSGTLEQCGIASQSSAAEHWPGLSFGIAKVIPKL